MSSALVVEDTQESALYLRTLLEAHGWTVRVASNGAEALAYASEFPPDVVISDLLMPVMDGYALLRQWKNEPRLSHIPFVVHTATYIDPSDRELALALGADAFILKPAEPDELIGRITAVLGVAAGCSASDDTLARHNRALQRKLEEKMLELERTNRELRRGQAELRLRERAMAAVAQGIVITDPLQPDNPIIFASSGFERLTGYSATEVVGRNCRMLQGPDTDPGAVSRLRDAVDAGRSATVALLNYRRDGSTFWNEVTLSPVFDAAGGVTHFVGVLSDVSDRRRLEEQLLQAQKLEAVGRLVAGVTHDFNNVLSVIISYAHLAGKQIGEHHRAGADLQEIRVAAGRASELVRQLLAFTRQQTLAPRVIDVVQLVAGMERMLRPLLGEHIRTTSVAVHSPAKVHADPSQIEQIVMNLCVNARDAMPDGGSLLIETSMVDLDDAYASVHEGVVPGTYVMLAVSDTGVGMDAALRQRVFEPFFTTKGLHEGTGLGLPIVLGIVKQSGGYIWVYSEPGKGATFKVYLPAVDRAVDAPSERAMPSLRRGTETVLLVEDDPQVLAVARVVLQNHGYSVVVAHNGEEALLAAEDHHGPIHLLLTDAIMPGMNGGQLALRLGVQCPELKVLLMSGYTQKAVLNHGIASPRHFLEKPLTPDALLASVRTALDDRWPVTGQLPS